MCVLINPLMARTIILCILCPRNAQPTATCTEILANSTKLIPPSPTLFPLNLTSYVKVVDFIIQKCSVIASFFKDSKDSKLSTLAKCLLVMNNFTI